MCTTISSASSENIDQLQAKATARLAKEEKDFTATIVVSDNDMYLLPNSIRGPKRNTKKPVRYNECVTGDDEEVDERNNQRAIINHRRRAMGWMHLVEHEKDALHSLQHVRVEVEKLPDLGLEPWCMVHQLYKCYCKGEAQSGEVFSLTNTKNVSSHWEVAPARKRQYTFDRGADDTFKSQAKVPRVEIMPNGKIRINASGYRLSDGAARVLPLNRSKVKRRTMKEINMLRNQCKHLEHPFKVILKQRIRECQSFFVRESKKRIAEVSADSNPMSTIDLTKADAMNKSQQSGSSVAVTPIERLNSIITDTMRACTQAQRTEKLTLNYLPNKLSICRWSQFLQAYNTRQISVWVSVEVISMEPALLLTESITEPRGSGFQQIENIKTVNVASLPLIAKLLRGNIINDKTNQLGKW